MIPLRVQRLKPRHRMRVTRGVSQNFELILALLALDDQTLYQARDIASQIHNPNLDRAAYQRLKTNIYQKGHRAGLIETNQNLDHRGKPQEPAKWDGFHWKKTINDGDWQRACKFFNALSERAEAHQKLGRTMHFFFDNKIGLIESPHASPKVVRQQLQQQGGSRQPFFEHWEITTLDAQPVAPKKLAPKDQASSPPPADDAPSGPAPWWPWPLLALLGLLGLGIWYLTVPSPTQRRIATITAIQQSNQPDQLWQLQRLFDDPAYVEQRDWLVETMIDKAVDNPTPAHMDILRHVYRTKPDHRQRLAWAIAEVERITDFNPLFPANPAQPWFVGAIDTNPVVLYQEGYLRPGNWVNINGVSGYVEEISKKSYILKSQSGAHIIQFDRVSVLNIAIFSEGNLICYAGKPNLQKILETICNIENWDFYHSGIDGHLGGSFHFETYKDFVLHIINNSSIEFDQGQVFSLKNDNFTVLLGRDGPWPTNVTIAELIKGFKHQIGIEIKADLPEYLKSKRVTSISPQLSDLVLQYQLKWHINRKKDTIQIFAPGGKVESQE